MDAFDQNAGNAPPPVGLRGRKKARRREEILTQARALFERKGIQATTMAEIAEAVGVSPPTIFNYFGNKDGILIALITEGSDRSREERGLRFAREDSDFGTLLVDMLCGVSEATLQIADKRVWRYAEAAAIRHPTTELARKYAANDMALMHMLRSFFECYDLRLRSGDAPDPGYLARVFFDVWTSDFFDLIKHEDFDLDAHRARLRRGLLPLVRMLFEDEFIKTPKLLQGDRRDADS